MPYIRPVIRKIYYACLGLGDHFIRKFIRPGKDNAIKKVLVIRLDSLGDFILWLDAAKGLRNLYPSDSYEVILLGNREWIELAEGLPLFDEVWELDRLQFKMNPLYRWRLLGRIKQYGFDIVIHPTFSREYYYGDTIAYVSGAKERIGSEGDLSNITMREKKRSDRWYSRLVPASKTSLMEIERNTEFLRGLGLESFQPNMPEFPIKGNLPKWLGNEEPYYLIFPGASWSGKQWPVDNFVKLAALIHERTSWMGLICGSINETGLGQQLLEQAGNIVKNYVGKTSLSELAKMIAHAKFIVGNDSGAMHIAAAVRTPAVCILGGGHFGRFMPYRGVTTKNTQHLPVVAFHPMDCFNCNWHCIYSVLPGRPVPCVERVTVEQAWKEIENICQNQIALI